MFRITPSSFMKLLTVAGCATSTGEEDWAADIYLASGHGALADAVGVTDILTAYSGHRAFHSAYTVEIDGQLPHDIVLSANMVPTLMAVARACKSDLLTVTLDGSMLTVKEIDMPNKVTLVLGESDYDIESTLRYLRGDYNWDTMSDSDDIELAAGNLVQLDQPTLKLLARMSNTLRAPLKVYKVSHPAGGWLVSAEPAWRGHFAGGIYSADTDVEYPDVSLGALDCDDEATADDTETESHD